MVFHSDITMGGGWGVGKGDASGGFESGKFPWMVYLVSVYLDACFGTFALSCKGFRLYQGLVFLRHASVMAHHHTPKNDLRGVIFSTPKSSKITHSFDTKYTPTAHLNFEKCYLCAQQTFFKVLYSGLLFKFSVG